MIRECVICGGAFESRQNRKTCSSACHAENRRRHQTEANHRAAQEQAARRGRSTAAGRALAGVNAAARAAHVSYGQYCFAWKRCRLSSCIMSCRSPMYCVAVCTTPEASNEYFFVP